MASVARTTVRGGPTARASVGQPKRGTSAGRKPTAGSGGGGGSSGGGAAGAGGVHHVVNCAPGLLEGKGDAASATTGGASFEEYVHNLQQQIYFLEMEAQLLKAKQDASSQRRSSRGGTGGGGAGGSSSGAPKADGGGGGGSGTWGFGTDGGDDDDEPDEFDDIFRQVGGCVRGGGGRGTCRTENLPTLGAACVDVGGCSTRTLPLPHACPPLCCGAAAKAALKDGAAVSRGACGGQPGR
jgi:hypothetical protein